jgi:hypothetical protein
MTGCGRKEQDNREVGKRRDIKRHGRGIEEEGWREGMGGGREEEKRSDIKRVVREGMRGWRE